MAGNFRGRKFSRMPLIEVVHEYITIQLFKELLFEARVKSTKTAKFISPKNFQLYGTLLLHYPFKYEQLSKHMHVVWHFTMHIYLNIKNLWHVILSA